MSALPEQRLSPPALGKILVERNLLTQEQLAWALGEHARTDRPLGEVVVAHGLVAAPFVAQALATQAGRLLKTEYGYATGFSGEAGALPAADLPEASSAETDALRLRFSELEGVAATLAADRDAARAAEAAALQHLAAVEGALAAACADTDAARAELAAGAATAQAAVAIEADRATWAERCTALEAELGTARADAEHAQTQFGELQSDAAQAVALAAEVVTARADAEQLAARCAALEQELQAARQHETSVAELQAELAAARVSLGEAAESNERSEVIEAELLSTRTRLADIEQEAENRQTRLAEADARSHVLEHAVAALEAELAVEPDDQAEPAAALEGRLAAVEAKLDEAFSQPPTRLVSCEAPVAVTPDEIAYGRYVVFTGAAGGYALLEQEGPIPRPGEAISVEGVAQLVVRVGPSPLPGERAPCVYVTRIA